MGSSSTTPTLPEGAIFLPNLIIGGKTADELKKQLEKDGIKISDYLDDILKSRDFTTVPNIQNLSLVRLKVSDLGFTNYPTTDQIYKKANELGLDLCPAEVGLHLHLKNKDQPMNDWYYVGMKPIADSRGDPRVFELGRTAAGLWLLGHPAHPDAPWRPEQEVVFCLRK